MIGFGARSRDGGLLRGSIAAPSTPSGMSDSRRRRGVSGS